MAISLPSSPAIGQTFINGTDIYIWDGVKWTGAGVTLIQSAEYGEVVLPNDVAIPPGVAGAHGTTLITFSVPSAGVWKLTALVFGYGGAVSSASAAFYDSSAVKVPNSEFGLMNTNTGVIGSGCSGTCYVVTSGPATFTLRAGAWTATSNALSNNVNGRTKVIYEKVSTNTPNFYQAGSWVDGGNITITTTGTTPTKPATRLIDRVRYRNVAPFTHEIEYKYAQNVQGSGGTGEYLFALPAGLQFNTSLYPIYTGAMNVHNITSYSVPFAKAEIHAYGTNHAHAVVVPYSNTQFRLWVFMDLNGARIPVSATGYGYNTYPNITYNIFMNITTA